mmetsp:Transcript_43147/g.119340  ORF Transcript_43147/g.119340 Transcript_43147/m.119340 type:complete len:319 (+) Transcript_43147:55-1011(+)
MHSPLRYPSPTPSVRTASSARTSVDSFWHKFACTPRCAVHECQDRCGAGNDDVNESDTLWARKPHESFDDPFADLDTTAVYQPPATSCILRPLSTDEFQTADGIPWAGVNGPSQQDLHGSLGGRSRQLGRLQGSSASQSPARGQSPVPSINPVTGFITLAVSACNYKAEPSDPMDVQMSLQLRALEPDAAEALMLRRLAPGIYEIDGTYVTLRSSADGGRDLFVSENGVFTPLAAYLAHAANIAMQIRPPAPRTLTFNTLKAAKLVEADSDDRFESMQVACLQAEVRERTAEDYHHAAPMRQLDFAMSPVGAGYRTLN